MPQHHQKTEFCLEIEGDDGYYRTIDLEPRDYTIGRRSQNDISFPSETTMSRVHAVLQWDGQAFHLLDQDSTFGSFVNGHRVMKHQLTHGDDITVGKSKKLHLFFREQKAMIGDTQENLAMMKKILRISKALNSSLRVEQVLEMVMDAVMEVTKGERGFLMLRDHRGAFPIKLARGVTSGQKELQSQFRFSESVINAVLKKGKSLIVRDIKDYSWLQEQKSIHSLELRSIMCVPLKEESSRDEQPLEHTMFFQQIPAFEQAPQDHRIFGLVYVDSKTSSKSFSQLDLEILESLSSHAAIAIRNSMLIQDLAKAEQFSSTLVEANKSLNSTLDLDELLHIIIDCAAKTLKAGSGTVYLIDTQRQNETVRTVQSGKLQGFSPSEYRHLVKPTLEQGNIVNLGESEISHSLYPKVIENAASQGFLNSLLCVPLFNKEKRLIGALEISNREGGAFHADDERMLSAFSHHASLAIENALMYKQVQEKKKLEHEIEVAAQMQQKLLPSAPPDFSPFDLDALTVQCKQVGGDYYDFIPLSDTHLAIAVADVSGKGIPAALLMANLQAVIRSQCVENMDPRQVVQNANTFLYKHSTANKYVTLCLGVLDRRKMTLTYVNAGHNPPLLRHVSGVYQQLETGGLVVGLLDNQQYQCEEVPLAAGELIVLYSDGVTEAENTREDEFGVQRLKAVIDKNHHRRAGELCDLIYEEITLFEHGTPRHDDVTLLVVKRESQ